MQHYLPRPSRSIKAGEKAKEDEQVDVIGARCVECIMQ